MKVHTKQGSEVFRLIENVKDNLVYLIFKTSNKCLHSKISVHLFVKPECFPRTLITPVLVVPYASRWEIMGASSSLQQFAQMEQNEPATIRLVPFDKHKLSWTPLILLCKEGEDSKWK